MKAFDYAIAENTSGAIAAIGKKYRVKAAGIDLLDMLKERTEPGDRFVSIHRVAELGGIMTTADGLRIGALATLAEIGDSELVRKSFPALAEAASSAATPQVRARATAAGNVLQRPRCWYFRAKEYDCLKKGGATCFAVEGENQFHALFGGGPCHITHASNIAPALVAVNAEIRARGQKDTRVISADGFFTLPDKGVGRENSLSEDELVTEFVIRKLPTKSAYVEFKEKQSFDWPLAACTVALLDGKWRVVLSHVAPIPWRATKAEEVLGGTADIDEALAEKAADAALEGAKPMRDNGYRLKLVRAAVRRSLLEACGKAAV